MEPVITLNDLPDVVLQRICKKLNNRELTRMYNVNVALRASSIYEAGLRLAELVTGPFDHNETLIHLHEPYFDCFGQYIQSL